MNKIVYTNKLGLKKGDISCTSDRKHWYEVVEDLGDGVYSVRWLDEYEPSKTDSSKKKIKD